MTTKSRALKCNQPLIPDTVRINTGRVFQQNFHDILMARRRGRLKGSAPAILREKCIDACALLKKPPKQFNNPALHCDLERRSAGVLMSWTVYIHDCEEFAYPGVTALKLTRTKRALRIRANQILVSTRL